MTEFMSSDEVDNTTRIDLVGHAVVAHELSTFDNSEAWLEARRKSIGSSDAPTILGLNPYAGWYSLWLNKTRGYATEQSEAAYWGQQLENAIANAYGDRNGYNVMRVTNVLAHPEYHWMTANLDRVAAGPAKKHLHIVEIKTAGSKWWEGDYPESWYAQVQHQLAVTGLDKARLAVLIGGQTYEQYDVDRDNTYIANLIEQEKSFWGHIVTGVAPPYDTAPDTASMLGSLHSTGERELTDEAADIITELRKVREAMSDLRQHKSELETRVKAELDDATFGVHNGEVVVTWPSHEVRRIDSKKVRQMYPDILDDVVTVKTQRRFTIK